ncbi:hypothetical protein ACWKWU_01880 [Chitinophaga lutea]
MRTHLFIIILFVVSWQTGAGQSHGLEFSSHEVVAEKRTSLDLTPGDPVCVQGVTELSFDLMLKPGMETYFGYIVRVLTTRHQNIDLVYNQRLATFHFVIGETITGGLPVDSLRTFGGWNRCRIRLDPGRNEASFYYNDKPVGSGHADLPSGTCTRIYFGSNPFEGFQTRDLPPMRIRDIRVAESGKETHFYPLSENEGTQVADQRGGRAAKVANPVWIKPKHQRWREARSFTTTGSPAVAFDPVQEVLFIVSEDSLFRFSFRGDSLRGDPYTRGMGLLPAGNQALYDPVRRRLFDIYIDEKKVAAYDPETRSWNNNFVSTELTEYWQANKFLSPHDSSIYIVGGYGQLHYKNLIQRYHIPTGRWTAETSSGDVFMPRYMAALGLNAAGDTAYVLGGYGSSTGDQAINPRYNYELLAFSIRDRRFQLRHRLPEPARQFCFANSLLTDGRDYYALIYPTDRFNSSLQLIRGSLDTPGYQLMGDSLPYSFYDIRSFADLYYAPLSRQLVAVTLYHDKNEITQVKIYTLAFPPNTFEAITPAATRNIPWRLIGGGVVLLLALGGIGFLLRKKRPAQPRHPHESPVADEPAPVPDTSAIWCFGQFEAFDRDGNDVAKLFTPLLRELFLLITVRTFRDGRGIAPEELYELLWSDKPLKDAKNNFSVNIVKLKGVLEKIGDCVISKDSGRWKLEILHGSIRLDYAAFTALIAARPAVPDKTFVSQLLTIVRRGSFLRTTHYEWLDDVKFDVSAAVIDALLQFISAADLQSEAEFIVRIAGVILQFDNLSEEALGFKCKGLIHLGRHSLARDAYEKFVKEYRESYGQDFHRTFADITQHAG